jgi:hypothetical protein
LGGAGRACDDAGMPDLLYVALTLAFFALAAAYVRFCDRVR